MRKDIQILRGLSVLSVVFYHFNKNNFPNGYFGVDIFFVISGFLITNIIKKEIDLNKFSIINFYKKRAKRILPAFFSTSMLTVVIGLYNLTEEQFYELLKGLRYSLFFGSNIYFSRIINYFSIDSERNLIINLWSLSIEEQFYILYPVLLFVCYKLFYKKMSYIILGFISISILSNSIIFFDYFNLNKIFFNFENYIFYSPITRAWQLLIGCLLSFFKPHFNLSINNSYILLSIAILLFMPIPGNIVLILIFLVSILILTEKDLIENNFIKPIVHLGNISFSLYLIHQPIIAGLRNHNYFSTPLGVNYIDLNSKLNNIFLIIIIYLLSLVNYRFIEQKFRYEIKNINTYKIFFASSILFFTFIFSFDQLLYKGLFNDVNTKNTEYNLKKGTNFLTKENNELCISQDSISTSCIYGNGEKDLYFLGDSTVGALITGFLNEKVLQKYRVIDYTQAGCFPIIGLCDFIENNQFYIDVETIQNSSILIGGRFDFENISKDNLYSTLQLLLNNQNNVIFVGYLPTHLVDEKMYFRKNKSFLMHKNIEFYNDQSTKNTEYKFEFSKIFNKINNNQLFYLEVFELFCEDAYCNSVSDNGKYYFYDYSHLSHDGAVYLFEYSNLKTILNLD